ncbi:hypothetical protein WL61_23195 [Burkholderia ubonensis]|uniref:DUF4376 domain-containing protein n=1 Tax=Burkholderia ubonensis TaxID=101571 RepID=UPI00075F01FA|nr:hypothetical protein [Burkholderia ubonensis]KVR28625.1 hypothetical protein WK14_07100 [Burkholderia ubonensis]KWD17048.1 hypothetical protein WL61_23195 [Burkholderia ubonensis]KWD23629.1 hypothetical protein WL62_14060 [Burkholderia ubonensis]
MGQKQAAYDATGAIIAFYDTTDSPAPKGAQVIDITDAEWLDCIGNQGSKYVQSGALAQVPPPTAAELLATAKSAKIAALNTACQVAIAAGFTSAALGSATFYPTSDTDQRNLQSSALAAAWNAGAADWKVSLWCERGDAWSYVAHTAQQVQQVNADWVTFRTSAQQKYAAAIDQVNAATTVDAVRAVAV